MTNLLQRMQSLTQNIRIGIVGIGSIGKGMVLQAQITPGIECVAIADVILERAITWTKYLQRDFQVVRSVEEMDDVISQGKMAVCADGDLVARCDLVEVFLEATNSIPAGGQYGITAIEHNKHLIMMNYEADLLFGPYLLKLAQEKDLIYSVCDGDQPAVLKHIIDDIQFMGFQLVMAGNIKGYLDRYTNPTLIIPEADKRNLDYKMCSSYTDGTKLGVEMAVLANGLGLRTAVPGMYGPRMDDINQVFEKFDFETLWKNEQPVVDYVLGAKPYGGVFVIGYTNIPYQEDTLAWFPPQMGPGPFYLFYRPYHLGHFESMVTVASAVLDRRATLKPDYGFQTNVYAYTKRDLRKGETLDGVGGYTCYGLVENCADNQVRPGLPILLAEKVTLKKDVTKDQKLFMEDIVYDPNDYSFNLHQKAMALGGKKFLPGDHYPGMGRSMSTVFPRVTVIIATYNKSAALKCAIDSVLWQTMKDFELWVIGDGCSDNSEEIVKSYHDPRVNWFNLPENSGYQSKPTNEGLRRAKGKYIAYLNHDDIWLPNHLQVLVEQIEKGKSDFVYSILEWVFHGTERNYADIPIFPNAPRPPEASVTLHYQRLVDEIGFWKLPAETYSVPRAEYFRRAQFIGKRFELVPRLTVLKFVGHTGKYADSAGQEAYLQEISTNSDFAHEHLAILLAKAYHQLERPVRPKKFAHQIAESIRRQLIMRQIDPARLILWRGPGAHIKRWRRDHDLDS